VHTQFFLLQQSLKPNPCTLNTVLTSISDSRVTSKTFSPVLTRYILVITNTLATPPHLEHRPHEHFRQQSQDQNIFSQDQNIFYSSYETLQPHPRTLNTVLTSISDSRIKIKTFSLKIETFSILVIINTSATPPHLEHRPHEHFRQQSQDQNIFS